MSEPCGGDFLCSRVKNLLKHPKSGRYELPQTNREKWSEAGMYSTVFLSYYIASQVIEATITRSHSTVLQNHWQVNVKSHQPRTLSGIGNDAEKVTQIRVCVDFWPPTPRQSRSGHHCTAITGKQLSCYMVYIPKHDGHYRDMEKLGVCCKSFDGNSIYAGKKAIRQKLGLLSNPVTPKRA